MPPVNIRLALYTKAIKLDLDIVEIVNRKLEEVIAETERNSDGQ